MQIPNLISALRLASAPALLYLAWHGYAHTGIGLLIAALISDMLDGYLARRWGQTSTFGAKLDSLADAAIFLTVPLMGWWLRPDVICPEIPYFVVALLSAAMPPIFHFCKFRTSTSYHTWSAKLAVFLGGVSVIFLFAGWSVWLFRVATLVTVVAAVEQTAIAFVLPQTRSDIPSFWHVTRQKNV